jgi:hypothetical protein
MLPTNARRRTCVPPLRLVSKGGDVGVTQSGRLALRQRLRQSGGACVCVVLSLRCGESPGVRRPRWMGLQTAGADHRCRDPAPAQLHEQQNRHGQELHRRLNLRKLRGKGIHQPHHGPSRQSNPALLCPTPSPCARLPRIACVCLVCSACRGSDAISNSCRKAELRQTFRSICVGCGRSELQGPSHCDHCVHLGLCRPEHRRRPLRQSPAALLPGKAFPTVYSVPLVVVAYSPSRRQG